MFTGIITHLGEFAGKKNHTRLTFKSDKSICSKLTQGSSISVNGVCLTVFDTTMKNSFSVDVMSETFKKTTLGDLRQKDIVNLELPATPQNFLSGHIVQGHVDGVGTVIEIKPEGNSKILKISVPSDISKYMVAKGSIALNGISLTIIKAGKTSFTVGIIPFTWKNTMLRHLKIGDKINIETDIIAKYLLNIKK